MRNVSMYVCKFEVLKLRYGVYLYPPLLRKIWINMKTSLKIL